MLDLITAHVGDALDGSGDTTSVTLESNQISGFVRDLWRVGISAFKILRA